MESLLGLPPMNNNDAFCSLISPLFTGPGDQPAYTADYSNRDNGLIYTANAKNAAGAQREHEDGLSPRRPRPRGEAERDSVEGRDGQRARSGDAEGAYEKVRGDDDD